MIVNNGFPKNRKLAIPPVDMCLEFPFVNVE